MSKQQKENLLKSQKHAPQYQKSFTFLQSLCQTGVIIETSPLSYTLSLVMMFTSFIFHLHLTVGNEIFRFDVKNTLHKIINQNNLVIYTTCVFLKLIIVLLIRQKYKIRNLKNNNQDPLHIISSYISVMIQTEHMLSAFLLYQNIMSSFVNYCISIMFIMIQSLFLQNRFTFGLLSYLTCSKKFLYLRSFEVIGWILISAFSFFKTSSFWNTILFSIYSCVFSLWYIKNGYSLFLNRIIRKIFLFLISTSISLSIISVQAWFLKNPLDLMGTLIKYAIINVIIFICLRWTLKQNKYAYQSMSLEEVNYEFYQNDPTDVDYKVWIVGFIRLMKKQNLPYLKAQEKEFYLKISGEKLLEQNIEDLEILFKSAISDRYKVVLNNTHQFYHKGKRLGNHESFKNIIMLQYSRFLLNQTGNYIKSALILQKINIQSLNFFDKISVYQLQKFIFMKNQRLNPEKHTNIQRAFIFQKVYEEIWASMRDLITIYTLSYGYLNFQQISTDKFQQYLDQIVQKQQKLGQIYEDNQHFIEQNRKFLFLFLFYKIYFNNQRLNKQQLDVQKNIYPLVKDQQKLQAHKWLFSNKTIIFSCRNIKKQLLIVNTNKQLSDILLYNKNQILNKPIQILMTRQTAQSHYQKMASYLLLQDESYYAKQKSNIVETVCLNKICHPLKIQKYYKVYINIFCQLQFICQLKVNQQNEYQDGAANVHINLQLKTQTAFQKTGNNLALSNSEFDTNSKSIFYKEIQQQIHKQSTQICKIKLFVIIFLILYVGSIIFSINSIFNSQVNKFNVVFDNYIKVLTCYRFPMILGTHYQRSILNIGNQTVLRNQLNTARQTFLNLTVEKGIQQTMFDEQLNRKNIYYPLQGSKNMNKTYNQIDLFYMMKSKIVSLSAPININSSDFQAFYEYIVPSYDVLLNRTKLQYHQYYQSSIVDIEDKIYKIAFLQTAFVLSFIIILGIFIFKFKQKNKLVLDTLFNLGPQEVQNIIFFWRKRQRQLFNFKKQTEIQSKFQDQDGKKIKSNLNRKSKTIIKAKFKINCIFILGAGIFVTIFVFIFYSNVNFIQQMNRLADFQDKSFNFLIKCFPIVPVINYGLFCKYTNRLYPSSIAYDNEAFLQRVNTLLMFGSSDYMSKEEQSGSLFHQVLRNYFYGNLCAYNPGILGRVGLNKTRCEQIRDGAFKNGLASFLRTTHKMSLNYYNNVTALSPTLLVQFNEATSVCTTFLLDAIVIFTNQFSQKISQLKDSLVKSVIVSFSVVAILVLITFFTNLIINLQKDYQKYRKVFKNMIPSQYINKEKLVRQQFINNDMLR